MYAKLIVALAFVAVAFAGNVKFEDCGHHEVVKLNISQCADGVATCVLHKGKPLALDAEMISNQDTAKISVHLSAKVEGLEIPIPGVDRDGCKYVKCPVKKGEHVHLNYALTVPKLLPNLHNVEIGAKISGDHGLLACLRLHGDLSN
ncbi:hypothetical protein TYRP_020235 [Tyrophagus putrescentiae]|nr:hypothetical protein TYRP_020235 [Tyrophagus putrescentiae]